MVDVVRYSDPVARKTHRCSCCHHDIEPGQQYHRLDIADAGGMYVWKECGRCVPSEDGLRNSRRPEDCWGDDSEYFCSLIRKWRPTCGGAYLDEDEPVMRMYAYFDYELGEHRAFYESYMIPLVGMTEWREVADQ